MSEQKTFYRYCGPVMLFGKCIESTWYGETWATSERKARSNLTYQFKKEFGYGATAKIDLAGNIEGGSV